MWLIIAIFFGLILYIGVRPFWHWKRKGVPYITPLPFFGNSARYIFRRLAFSELFLDVYLHFSGHRYFGFYHLLGPVLMIRDPDLIKTILIKEFDAFPQHSLFVEEDVDPLWSSNVFAIQGKQKWKNVRSTISPVFTSSKIKLMLPLMQNCAKQFIEFYAQNDDLTEVEFKDAFTRLSNDIITTTSFGIECDSLKNPDNVFYKMSYDVTDLRGINAARFLLSAFCPFLMKLFKIGIISKKATSFYGSIIKDAIKLREEQGIIRQDIIHLLVEARKGRLSIDQIPAIQDAGYADIQEAELITNNKGRIQLTDDEITAQGIMFFFAGFDSISSAMSFAIYEIAVNPEVQRKLIEEVDVTVKGCNGEFTYEALMGMKYLDMVISETLRKWPIMFASERASAVPFTIDPKLPGETTLHLEAGTTCCIPTFAIHRDPKYYPNPDTFDPERFSEENKKLIVPYTYLPFGLGPRNCIGLRFALIETKLIIAEILSKYEVVPVEKTQIPIKLDKVSNPLYPEKGVCLGLKARIRSNSNS